MMAATLLCKRVVSRPNLCCSSLHHQATHIRNRRPRSRMADSDEEGCLPTIGGSDDIVDAEIFQSLRIRLEVHGSLDPPMLSCCNFFLKRLLKATNSRQIAKPFLAQMLLLGAIPPLSTYSIIIKSYCQNYTYQDVLDLVKQTKAMEVKVDASFCKALIDGACACFKPHACHHILQRLRSIHQVQLPLACYDSIMRHFCRTKPIVYTSMSVVLLRELMKMIQLRIYPDEKIYNILLNARQDPDIDDGMLLKVVVMGGLMFSRGIRIGAVNPTTACGDIHKGGL